MIELPFGVDEDNLRDKHLLCKMKWPVGGVESSPFLNTLYPPPLPYTPPSAPVTPRRAQRHCYAAQRFERFAVSGWTPCGGVCYDSNLVEVALTDVVVNAFLRWFARQVYNQGGSQAVDRAEIVLEGHCYESECIYIQSDERVQARGTIKPVQHCPHPVPDKKLCCVNPWHLKLVLKNKDGGFEELGKEKTSTPGGPVGDSKKAPEQGEKPGGTGEVKPKTTFHQPASSNEKIVKQSVSSLTTISSTPPPDSSSTVSAAPVDTDTVQTQNKGGPFLPPQNTTMKRQFPQQGGTGDWMSDAPMPEDFDMIRTADGFKFPQPLPETNNSSYRLVTEGSRQLLEIGALPTSSSGAMLSQYSGAKTSSNMTTVHRESTGNKKAFIKKECEAGWSDVGMGVSSTSNKDSDEQDLGMDRMSMGTPTAAKASESEMHGLESGEAVGRMFEVPSSVQAESPLSACEGRWNLDAPKGNRQGVSVLTAMHCFSSLPGTIELFTTQIEKNIKDKLRRTVHSPDEWAVVLYFEFNVRCGNAYYPSARKIQIDGYCNTADPRRLSIGSIGNGARLGGVAVVRGQIGKGLELDNNGVRCSLLCLMDSPLFVQSPMHARKLGDDPATVYRLPGSTNSSIEDRTLEVFDMEEFTRCVEEAKPHGYRHVYALQSMCIARASFVKGFGASYRRQTIMDTPVWVEIHFLHALKMLDQVLNSLAPPSEVIRSFS